MKIKTEIIIFFIGLCLGWFIHYYTDGFDLRGKTAIPIRQDSPEFKYIDPLLVIDNSDEEYTELKPLKKKFENYIEKSTKEGRASAISIYFRDLNTIAWTGINEDDKFSPGSMLKVTTLLAYLKAASQNPEILNRQIYYDFKGEDGQYYKPEPLKTGYYPASVLLQQMIKHSDNTAMRLVDESQTDNILKIYDELKLPNPIKSPRDFMSAREYSRLFRLLYNATYLPRNLSEQALELLTYAGFNRGIKNSIPGDIPVAHKFGEQTFLQDGSLEYRELHDCGIIYYPHAPYVLCIMTKGQDFKTLETIIANLSKIAFDYQSKK